MTSQQFSNILHDPGLLDNTGLELVEVLAEQYPYCQSGQLLFACGLHAVDSPYYPLQLKKAAAYAGDRSILKQLTERSKNVRPLSPDTAPHVPPLSPVIPDPKPQDHFQPVEFPAIFTAGPAYEPMTQEELLAIVKKRLAEINAEKKRDPELPEIPATKASLIDKFIQDEPRISKPRAAFFNPTDSAIRSNFDEEEIVSETLAQLYAQQGNLQKAKHIYEKLSLINQEKSRYFAAQIEKLSS